MPATLRNRKLQAMVAALEVKHRDDPAVRLGSNELLQLLAQAGTSKWSPSRKALFDQLRAPGLSQDAQAALVRKGLSAQERADLATLLRSIPVPLAAEARGLLEQVLSSPPAAGWGGPAPAARPSRPTRPVDLPDPALHPDELRPDGTPMYGKQRFTGPLYGPGGPTMKDVQQGYLSDCYFLAGLGAIMHTRGGAETLKAMVKDNGDGSYTVTFKERDRRNKFQDVPITVDGDLYAREDGSALYAKNPGTARDTRLLFPVIEKAYASWRGGYENITEDTAANLYEAVLGKSSTHQPITRLGERTVFETLTRALAENRPISAGTRGTEGELPARDIDGRAFNIYGAHQYSVLGAAEQGGRTVVTLRNPWGKIDRDDAGATNGVFSVDLATFKKAFASLSFVDPERSR